MRGRMARKRVVVADLRGVRMDSKGAAGCGANRQVLRGNVARDASQRHGQDTPTSMIRLYLLVSHDATSNVEAI